MPLRYAVIGDTHIDPDSDVEADAMRRVFGWLESLDPAPDFVVHVGDIVECGFEEQFAAYEALIPVSLRPRLFHLPGNHETRWDEHANRKFDDRFPAAPFSFDTGGVHFVGLDPTTHLQELGQFGEAQLGWLRRDLELAGPGTPAVLLFHFPVGGRSYFISDQDALFDALDPYNVVAIHAGHIHSEQVLTVNGFTQVTGRSQKTGPTCHIVDRDGDDLVVSSLDLSGEEAAWTALATIPLFAHVPMPGGEVEVRLIDDGAIGVTVPGAMVPEATQVRVRTWPNHVYGRQDRAYEGWTALQPDHGERPSSWTGGIQSSGLVPGRDRIEVVAEGEDGPLRQWAVPFELPSDTHPILWEWRVGEGAVQAGLVASGEMLIASTTSGDIVAFRVTEDGPVEQWRYRDDDARASVLGTPVVDGDTLFVGSRSGRVMALDASDGSLLWQRNLVAPVIASLGLAGEGSDSLLLVPVEGQLHALGARDGVDRWVAQGGGFLGGRPVSDGRYVYASFGDGTLRAFAREDGREVWSRLVVERDRRYSRLLYSAWAHKTLLLPGMVMTSTVEVATARDRATGEVVWSLPGGFMYAAGVLLPDEQTLVLASEAGVVHAVDAKSGEIRWQTELGHRVLNAGPVVHGIAVYVPGAGGQLAILELPNGEETGRIQLGGTALVSTPVIAGGLLLAGGQDGRIRAVRT